MGATTHPAALFPAWYVAPTYTDEAAAAWWEHANQSAGSLNGGALRTGGWCNGSTADAVQTVGVQFPQSDHKNEASLHAYPQTCRFESGPQLLLDDPIHQLGETTVLLAPTAAEVQAATLRVQEVGGSLTEAEVRAVLTEAGWPAELHDAALAVAWCESRWSPYAVGDGGNSLGLFQLNVATWFRYAGEDPALWAEPLVNARTAWATYNYDLGRGYEPWKQWSCKP